MSRHLYRTIHTSSRKMARFEGRVAIVTASSEGIGFAIAERLAREGAGVMISSRKQDKVDMAVKQLQAENLNVAGMVCHAGKDDHRKGLIDETVKKFGRIDMLVCNAAVNPAFGSLLSTTDEQWDKMFDINVKSTFKMCRDVLPHMEKQGKGSIVLVSSIAGYLPMEGIPAYSVTKTALLGLTKALANATSGTNMRVNCVAPGIIKTRFSEALWKSDGSNVFVETLPIKRFGTPEDCAGTVAFLLSDDASYITGETVVIAGGMNSRL